MKPYSLPLTPNLSTLSRIIEALLSEKISLVGMQTHVPGPLPIRMSVVLGNLRMHRIMDTLLRPGDTVVDVGANIGYNALYAAHRVGPHGRMYAIEPAQDNLSVLYANLFANSLRNVIVLPYAAGTQTEIKQFFLRGEVSAVNSLYQNNFYAPITSTVEVLAMPLDDLIPETPALVKIDVEGGEIGVLLGMERILRSKNLHLIVEWHPTLQEEAGHPPDALPLHLSKLGFTLQVVTHTYTALLSTLDIPTLARKLLNKRSPVELLAYR